MGGGGHIVRSLFPEKNTGGQECVCILMSCSVPASVPHQLTPSPPSILSRALELQALYGKIRLLVKESIRLISRIIIFP